MDEMTLRRIAQEKNAHVATCEPDGRVSVATPDGAHYLTADEVRAILRRAGLTVSDNPPRSKRRARARK
jgi:hypothetical protein